MRIIKTKSYEEMSKKAANILPYYAQRHHGSGK